MLLNAFGVKTSVHENRVFGAIVSENDESNSMIEEELLFRASRTDSLTRIAFGALLTVSLSSLAYAQAPAPPRVPNYRPVESTTLVNDVISKAFQQDATLRSVFCVSSDRIVAVGDRGTVLVTKDAGRTWRLAPTPVSANLYDVKFSGDTGYAVGGWIGSETGRSYGTMIRTTDGGESWEMVNTDMLPRLIGIQLEGAKILCWGDYSSQLNASAFSSDSTLQIWQPIGKGLASSVAASSNASGQIAVIDQLSRCKIEPNGSVQVIGHPNNYFNDIEATNDRWIAAGESGELIASSDGSQWENVTLPLRPEVQRLCSWNCIEQKGNTLWLAGSPGSIVLRSNNGGKNWQLHKTGQLLPIHKLSFIDPNRGWAVGPAGTILATRDGGATWYAQRKQPERACLMTLSASAEGIPWLAASATIWDQKRTAVSLIHRHAEPIDRARPEPSRESFAKENARRIGLAELRTCDTSSDEDIDALNRLATEISVWRPDVLLHSTHFNSSLTEQSNSLSINKLVKHLESPEFRQLVESLGLAPWPLPKLVATTPASQGEYTENVNRVLRETGLSMRDLLVGLPKEDRQANSELNMSTTVSRSQSLAARSELLGGFALTSDTQLNSKLASMGNYQFVMGRVQRDRAIGQLVAADKQLADSKQWMGQLKFLLPSVPPRELPQLYSHLTESLLARQQWHLADLLLQQLMTSDSSDIGLWASQQYIRLVSSREQGHWISRSTASQPPSSSVAVEAGKTKDNWVNTPFSAPEIAANEGPGVALASATFSSPTAVVSAGNFVEELHHSNFPPLSPSESEWTTLTELTFKRHPQLRSNPQMQMLLAKNFRESNNETGLRNVLSEVASQTQMIAWSQAAKQELALLDQQESQLRWLARASKATSLPTLDGLFDEPFWQNENNMSLTSLTAQQSPTEISWAYDLEYLYLAIRCPFEPNQIATPLAKVRFHDSDLQGLDHVELMIDVDRDYVSTIDLAIAENGLTYDRCMDQSSFNPKWHVKVASAPGVWHAEVAIKLDTLVDEIPKSGACWAVSARRVRPDRAPQSWSQLRTHQRLPEAAGILLFE
jgi:photosystem II stability/assembly factor-like uncharacterized protein